MHPLPEAPLLTATAKTDGLKAGETAPDETTTNSEPSSRRPHDPLRAVPLTRRAGRAPARGSALRKCFGFTSAAFDANPTFVFG